jgi:hypothetical protein
VDVATTPCPRCRRGNAAYRVTCLYCGERMPNPTGAPPPAPRTELPAELDQLVRAALTGQGGVGAIREVLSRPRPAVDQDAATEEAPRGYLTPPPRSRPDALADRVVELGGLVRHAVRAGASAHALIDDLSAAVVDLRAALPVLDSPSPTPAPPAPREPEPEPARPIELPPARLPWALALHGTAEATVLAEALQVDAVTARAAALAAGTRIVLRSADRDAVDRRVANARRLALRARTITREMLLTVPAAWTAVGWDGERVRAVDAALWEDPPEPGNLPAGEAFSLDGVLLAVPGEVEVSVSSPRREPGRLERSRYEPGTTAGTSTRVGVLDLHLLTGIVRVVETVTDFRGLNADSTSARPSYHALVEDLGRLLPGVPAEPRRVCPTGTPRPTPDGRILASGWPTWEEHSRVCRALRVG